MCQGVLYTVLMNVHPVLALLQSDERAAIKRIVEAYEAADCEVAGAVREIGVSRQTFYRWLEQFPALDKALADARMRLARSVLASKRATG